MARDLITPVQLKSPGDTTASHQMTASWVTISTANGAYIKSTEGDASKLILMIQRDTNSTAVGTLTVPSGSTATVKVYRFTGNYLSAYTQTVATSTGKSTDGANVSMIMLGETSRYKDTDDYIKFNFSTELDNMKIAAIFLP